ncbi:MCE family protein [Aeromicrobium sp. CTD01-1L150]|uniref:MCE family protein n=1 Tax=Aeromicrobium sp. CTD01-1L150 TaxID=3341830 RepID=UPI0035C1D09F
MSRRVPLRHRTAATGLAAVLVLVSVHLYTSVLGGSVSERPLSVQVHLESTGGLFEGSGVTYRGVRVGRVEEIRGESGGVVARLSLQPDADVPAATEAAVRTLSPAGEQFLDLQPGSPQGPRLVSGDVIEAERTSTPTSIAQTLRAVDDLMSEVDTDALQTTLSELRVAFENGDDLGRVLDSTSSIVHRLDDLWPETERLLGNSRTVLETGVDAEDDLRAFATSAKSLAAHLAEHDDELESHLQNLPAQTDQVRELVSLAAVALPSVLREMIGFTDMTLPREQHLRELLQTFPVGFDRFRDAIEGGRLQTTMLVASGLVCSYGAGEPEPKDPNRRPIDPDRSCPESFAGQVRGSSNVPPPESR